MKTSRISFLGSSLVLILLSSFVYRTASACPLEFGGPTTFRAAAGTTQTQTWIIAGLFGSTTSFSITSGSDVFTIGPVIPTSNDSGFFTITFNPGANASGTYNGTLKCPCSKTIELVGTTQSAGVQEILPANVALEIFPNPSSSHFNFVSTNVRSVKIGVYDLIGNQVASSNSTDWKWDASNAVSGAYIVRVDGESFSGDQFVISRRIFVRK